jgi:hypothetical protein
MYLKGKVGKVRVSARGESMKNYASILGEVSILVHAPAITLRPKMTKNTK